MTDETVLEFVRVEREAKIIILTAEVLLGPMGQSVVIVNVSHDCGFHCLFLYLGQTFGERVRLVDEGTGAFGDGNTAKENG